MFHSALICTDFSDGLYRLTHFVPELVAGGVNQLTFLHSARLWEEGEIPRIDEEAQKQARDRLSSALDNVPSGAEVKIDIQSGSAKNAILRAVETHQPEIIILGATQKGLLNEKLFGSTTLALSQRTNLPLLVLRPQLILTYTREELALRCQHLFRYLLLPYYGSATCQYLVERVQHYAQQRPPQSLETCLLLRVLGDGSVVEKNLAPDYQQHQAEEMLAEVQSRLEQMGLAVETVIEHGEPFSKIMQTAETFDVSAIAIAVHHSNPLVEWSVPTLGRQILRESWFPVLFFPPQHS